jgi:hypothetical protein
MFSFLYLGINIKQDENDSLYSKTQNDLKDNQLVIQNKRTIASIDNPKNLQNNHDSKNSNSQSNNNREPNSQDLPIEVQLNNLKKKYQLSRSQMIDGRDFFVSDYRVVDKDKYQESLGRKIETYFDQIIFEPNDSNTEDNYPPLFIDKLTWAKYVITGKIYVKYDPSEQESVKSQLMKTGLGDSILHIRLRNAYRIKIKDKSKIFEIQKHLHKTISGVKNVELDLKSGEIITL